MILGLAQAQVYNFNACLKCFHNNFYDLSYYCNMGDGSCKKSSDTRCNVNDMKNSYLECVRGFVPCNNQTFTVNDFLSVRKYSKTLAPGYGCFMNVNRTLNGTWGQLNVTVVEGTSTEDLLIFDEDLPSAVGQQANLTNYLKPLTYADNGWKPRKIFVVNANAQRSASFVYQYDAAMALKATFLAAVALIASV